MRVFLPLTLFLGLVAGIAWMSQYLPAWRKSSSGLAPAPAPKVSPLRFSNVNSVRDEVETGYVGEYEQGVEGHLDFLFENNSGRAIELGLATAKACTCRRVEVCLLDDKEAHPLFDQEKKARVGESKFNRVKLAHARADLERLTTRLAKRWQVLQKDDNRGIKVPAGTPGVLRLVWRARESDQLHLKAQFWMQPSGSGEPERTIWDLERIVQLVPPVRIHPSRADVGDLYAKSSVSKTFLVWSSTRDGLDVRPAGEQHPCVFCEVKHVPPAQFALYEKNLRAEYNTRIQSACLVRVTLFEEKEDHQLDVGTLLRAVPLAGTADGLPVEIPSPVLRGRVRSDIRVLGTDELGQINLHSFKARDGTAQQVKLQTRANVKLTIQEPRPAFLVLKLARQETVASETTWELDVSVPAGLFQGQLPEDTAVVLAAQSPGRPSRRVRIHITGTAARD